MGYDIEDPDEVLETLTPKRLKKIAKTLDFLSAIVAEVLREADEVLIGKDSLSAEDIDYLLEWVEGTEMQDDIRAWAKALKRVRKEAKLAEGEPTDEEIAVELVTLAVDILDEDRSGITADEWLHDANDFLFWYALDTP